MLQFLSGGRGRCLGGFVLGLGVWVLLLGATPLWAASFATSVISSNVGTGGSAGFTNPNAVLGSPERFTGEGVFPSAVTPFNAPFGTDELFSIGEGGHITVAFDQPILNNPANPFGIDLLIFGNAFYFDSSFPNGVVGGSSTEGGIVEVSSDGVNFFTITGIQADGLFPTLGYLDLTGAFDTAPGSVPSNFSKPVDPAFDPSGLNFAQLVAGYAGSGGGVGIDLEDVMNDNGLSSISFVRVSNPIGSDLSPEIDAFSVVLVPEPASVGILAVCLVTLLCRQQRRQ